MDSDVPVIPVHTSADALNNDPHVKAREMVVEVERSVIWKMKTLGVAVKLSETPGAVTSAEPTLGWDTRETLAELDYWKAEVDAPAARRRFDSASARENGVVVR